VKLTVKSNIGGFTNSTLKEINLLLKPGDLIFCRSPKYSTLFSLAGMDYTHVGMYIGNSQVIETTRTPPPLSNSVGVQITPLARWFNPTETYVTIKRVNVDQGTRNQAIAFARTKLGKPYDKNVLARQLNGPGYYCSELIWASYYSASNTKINLGKMAPTLGVSPDAIYGDSRLTMIGFHRENWPI
jgi:uncharacterized protein YycO